MIQIGASPATIDTPVEHLIACHRRIEQRLNTLISAPAHIGTNRIAALDAIRKSLHFLDTSGTLHTEDEELSLFPRLRQKLSASELEFVDSLEAQHAEAEALFAELKKLALEPDLDVTRFLDYAARLRSLYSEHIRAEDEILTAMARRSLDESEIAEISREMRARRARQGAH